MTPVYRYAARLHRVIDGDTFELDVDLGFGMRARVPIRLRGYSSPERFTSAGIQATAAVVQLLRHSSLVVETLRVKDRDVQTFARYVADVYIDGESLGARLARLGHATATYREAGRSL